MIRKVTAQDAEAIAEIYNDYVRNSVVTFETVDVTVDEMRGRIAEASARFPYLVDEEGSRVIGFCYAHRWKERAAYAHTWETSVYVANAACGRGVGSRLMACMMEACRRAGAHTLVACITGSNEESIALFRRLGFRQVSHFRQVGLKFGRWLDMVDFQLTL